MSHNELIPWLFCLARKFNTLFLEENGISANDHIKEQTQKQMDINRQHAAAEKNARKEELRQKAEERKARIEAIKAKREQEQAERRQKQEEREAAREVNYLNFRDIENGLHTVKLDGDQNCIHQPYFRGCPWNLSGYLDPCWIIYGCVLLSQIIRYL